MLLFVGIHNASYLFGIPMMVQVLLSPSSNGLFITQLRVLKACRLILKNNERTNLHINFLII